MKNAVVKYFCQKSGCHKVFSSVYKPSTAGICERAIQTILQRLKVELSGDQNWSQRLPSVLFALCGTLSVRSTLFSPFFIMFGQEMRFPFNLSLANLEEPQSPISILTSKEQSNASLMRYVEVIHLKLELVRQLARENILDARLQYKIQFDKKVREVIFEVGSKVLLYTPTNRLGSSHKVTPRFTGRYLITSRISPQNYTLRNCSNLKNKRIVNDYKIK